MRLHLTSECGAIYILTLHVDNVLLLGKYVLALRRIKQKLMSRFSMTDKGQRVTRARDGCYPWPREGDRDHHPGEIYKSLLEWYGTASCKSTYTPGVGKELSLDQPEERIPSMEEITAFPGHHRQRNVPWTGDSLWHLIRRHQLVRALSNPSKAHMTAAKHLLRYLAGTVDFAIT